ncbi:MAG: CO dehydrogenase/acetyl-CoA synthase subunit delta [Actinomycetia bacterium]|nr:CO dehydrogenase/acetyl-CoA synthase subunit delta [Actinomycetes bacterium]
MTFEAPTQSAKGRIREVVLGGGDGAVTVGGQNAMAFHSFDGEIPHAPIIAMEVYDAKPEGWADALVDALGDVMDDPAAWAKACVEQYGADAICVQLASTDPNAADTSPEDAAATGRAVVDAVNVPVLVYGSGNAEKDAEVLKKVAETVTDVPIALGPATEDNYKPITATALGYGHIVITETPIDVNMAKQLNILITQMGLAADRILIDPSTGAIGYGIEYSFTVMERLRLAALNQNDSMTQMPMVCNLGKETWRAKEARANEEDEPSWGDVAQRGVLWEATTAITLATSGTDILVMRHPESAALVRTAIEGLSQ